jgi:hypothetical protein
LAQAPDKKKASSKNVERGGLHRGILGISGREQPRLKGMQEFRHPFRRRWQAVCAKPIAEHREDSHIGQSVRGTCFPPTPPRTESPLRQCLVFLFFSTRSTGPLYPSRQVRYRVFRRIEQDAGTVHNNRFAKLIDSYRLATKEPPPAGQILVHNRPDSRGFRAWWTTPSAELVLCGCGWRPRSRRALPGDIFR